ncbi:kinase-like protein, partial [Thelephora ganbajun]
GLVPDAHKIGSTLTTSQLAVASGGFFDVWKATNENGEVFAIKAFRMYQTNAVQVKKKFCREAVAWKHLQHPNILPLLGATISKSKLCLISEWMDQGNVAQYLEHRENLEVNRIELLVDILDGLAYMHSLHVVHGNLKGVCRLPSLY